jgi:hypothetical protein
MGHRRIIAISHAAALFPESDIKPEQRLFRADNLEHRDHLVMKLVRNCHRISVEFC